MTNFEKYEQAFIEAFSIQKEELTGLNYQGVETWDSVGHMRLMVILEDAFNIMFDTDDIIDFSSFEKGKEILKKYDVEIE